MIDEEARGQSAGRRLESPCRESELEHHQQHPGREENARLRKKYDQLRAEYLELEIRHDSLWADKSALAGLLHDQMVQLCQLRKMLSQSVELAEYERLRAELEQSVEQFRALAGTTKMLRKQLEEKEAGLAQAQPAIEELKHQNQQLRHQIHAIGQNRDTTAKLLCDIELLQARVNESLATIGQLTDENHELRSQIEQYRLEYHRSDRSTLESHASLMSVRSPSQLQPPPWPETAGGTIHQTQSYSSLGRSVENMADIKIADLEQQIAQLQQQLSSVAIRNPPPVQTVDRPVQTDEPVPVPVPSGGAPVSLFCSAPQESTKKTNRCPLEHHPRRVTAAKPMKRKRRRRFLCLF